MNRIHCAYHKCLTLYFGRVMHTLYERILRTSGGYRHFNSRLDDFYAAFEHLSVASVNNHVLDRTRLGNHRITRFVRDPRDLVVSGYFYHRRGAEDWSRIVNPTPDDLREVNGTRPAAMSNEHSYQTYLESLSKEDGLIAEIEFRARHFESMLAWPEDDAQLRTFRYEDILGREVETFREILAFYEVTWAERWLGHRLARHYSASKQRGSTSHIRDPKPSQWKEHFTERVEEHFVTRWGELLERYRYETATPLVATVP